MEYQQYFRGTERIARLLGIKNYQQRNLSQSPVSIIETVDGLGKKVTHGRSKIKMAILSYHR
jgi:hypothetical protein